MQIYFHFIAENYHLGKYFPYLIVLFVKKLFHLYTIACIYSLKISLQTVLTYILWGRLKKLKSHQIQFSYLSKHGRLFPRVTEWIYLPAHPGAPTGSELLLKEGEAQGMLVYHGIVVGTGLIIHTPPSQHKLKTA